MKRNRLLYLALWAVVSCMFVSCMDDKYDLDDVDLTLGTSSDLTLPTSSTGDIVLKNILDLEEDGIVQSVNGEYFIVEDGMADVPRIDIDRISIPSPSLSKFKTSIDVNEIAGNARMTATASEEMITISLFGYEVQIPNMTYEYTIKDKDNAHYDIDVTSSEVPSEVVSLEKVVFVDETTLDADIQVYFDEDHSFINKVHLDNLKITLPKGLHVSKAVFRHWTEVDGEVIHKDEEVAQEDIHNDEGYIQLTKIDKNIIVGRENENHEGHEDHGNHKIDVLITFDQAVTGYDGFTFENGEVGLKGLFKIDGTFRLEAKDFTLTEQTIPRDLADELIKRMSFDVIRPDNIDFEGGAAFTNSKGEKIDIQVKSVSGQVKSDIGDIAPIVLNDMPDFLNDPDVRLDLANPAIFVEVNNPLPAEAKTTITLTSVYSDGKQPVIKNAGITVPANKHVVFCMAEAPGDVNDIPSQYAGLEIVPVQIVGLGDLLEILPKEIHVDLEDVTMAINDLSVPSTYDLQVSYQVYTPLEFGENFKLVYQGTEEGIGDDLADVDKLNTKEIRIQAKAVTDFPLNLTLSVDALDRYNKSLKGEVVMVDDIVINGHKGGAEYSEQDITLTVKPMAGHSIGELLQRLDKFHYRAEADAAGAEGKLMENSFVKLTNVRITLVGGISYDAN